MSENEKKVTGGISVEAEHIFPVIKKWLYSDKEIFLREIVSNASDAVTKLRRLISLAEVKDIDDSGFKVQVELDKENGTVTVRDNGIGMTEEEVSRYICQIALSGALEFIEKYEQTEGDNAQNGIIGHFGLGFYSAFMVSERVELITRSYKNTPAIHWISTSDGRYEMEEYEGDCERGTTVIMHISEEGKEYLEEANLRAVLDKYCSFMPVEIYFSAGEKEHKEEGECGCAECKEPKPINDTHPLWQKSASDCTKEEYTEFYQKVFTDFREPLISVHINADYPLNFKGILFFPKMQNEFENPEGQIKLYYNQVFVSDNIKEVIPEYLLMLRGVLDCPELPLNVSRSYLQSNGYVKKISAHIVKKVADKLCAMKENERENYEKIWRDIKTFVEYSSLCDPKFYNRAKDAILLEETNGKHVTLSEYLEEAKEKHENKVYYTSDPVSQAQYVALYEAEGINVVRFERMVDTQFVNLLESENKDVKFFRVDADVAGALKKDGEEAKDNEALSELFKRMSGNEKLKVSFEHLKDASVPAILSIPEEARRFEDMMKLYSMTGAEGLPLSSAPESNLVLNMENSLIASLAEKAEYGEKDEAIAKQIYNLSTLSQRRLSADELKSFLSDSYSLLARFLG